MMKEPILLLILLTSLAMAQPPMLPLIVRGDVEIDGEPAPVGTQILAEVNGETIEYSLTEPGVYAITISGTPETSGKEVRFYVDGALMEQTVEWRSGEIEDVDFSIGNGEEVTTIEWRSGEIEEVDFSIGTGEEVTTSSTLPETTATTSSTSLPVSTSSTTTTLPETTIPTSSTLPETTVTTLKAPTTIPKTTTGQEEINPKVFLLAILGIILVLLLSILAVIMKRN